MKPGIIIIMMMMILEVGLSVKEHIIFRKFNVFFYKLYNGLIRHRGDYLLQTHFITIHLKTKIIMELNTTISPR